MARILLCAVDGGAYNALSPVAELLLHDGHQIFWATEAGKPASVQLKKWNSVFFHEMADDKTAITELLGSYLPAVVIAGVSGQGPDLTLSLSQRAVTANIPVVKVIDFWGTGMPHEKGFAPNRVCCLDEATRGYESYMREMPLSQVFVTGGPQFDNLMWTKPLSPQELIRGPTRPFLLLCGPSTTSRVREVADVLFPAIADIQQPLTLGTLWHPKSEKAEYEDEIAAQLVRLPQVHHIDDATLRYASNDVLLASSDIVIGSTSTELVKACYLCKPALSIVPKGGHNHEVLTSRGIDMMPTSVCGATAHAENAAEVSEFFRLFFPETQQGMWSLHSEFMKKAQMLHYKLDGQNAERVKAVVESLL